MSDNRVYSVNDVIASLPDLHGQTIQIVCALQLEFEGNCIWHIPKAERRFGFSQSTLWAYQSTLWANFDHESLKFGVDGLKQFNGRHLIVTATVDQTMQGHFSLWPGSVLIRAIAKRK